MGDQGLKFCRSSLESNLDGPLGMIASDDVVLILVEIGTGFFRIKAMDALHRETILEPRSFTIQ